MKDRCISVDDVTRVIRSPDSVLEEPCKKIFQKMLIVENTLYIYRVYLNVCKKPPLVITVYRSTKLSKYAF